MSDPGVYGKAVPGRSGSQAGPAAAPPAGLSLRVVDDPDDIDPQAWDALLVQQPCPTPFMRHAFLAALHRSGSATAATGWSPRFVLLEDALGLAAAAPAYAKSHSWGEYVFDWAWADAYRRHGLRYYPKLVCAVPFTPAHGSRLMARDPEARLALAQALRELAAAESMSSAHVLFAHDTDLAALQGDNPSQGTTGVPAGRQTWQAAEQASGPANGWMWRQGVQFHWEMPESKPWCDFDAMLASLQRHKRKNIQQERRKVREAGVSFQTLEGLAIDDEAWSFFHDCYTATYEAHGSRPYLNRAFWTQMQRHMAPHWVMFVASRSGQRIGASLVALDPERRVAWGRYWGCTEPVPLLHFEACYYQPLAWCIANGYRSFEGGAQGEHKLARGLLPVPTGSAHWLADSRFAAAVDQFLAREGTGIDSYIGELNERSPFRPAG